MFLFHGSQRRRAACPPAFNCTGVTDAATTRFPAAIPADWSFCKENRWERRNWFVLTEGNENGVRTRNGNLSTVRSEIFSCLRVRTLVSKAKSCATSQPVFPCQSPRKKGTGRPTAFDVLQRNVERSAPLIRYVAFLRQEGDLTAGLRLVGHHDQLSRQNVTKQTLFSTPHNR